MEKIFEDRLIKKEIKKIKRVYKDNIFSLKLNHDAVRVVMNYLDKQSLL